MRSSLSSFKARREATDHVDTSPRELAPEQHKSKFNYVEKKKILKSTAFCSAQFQLKLQDTRVETPG